MIASNATLVLSVVDHKFLHIIQQASKAIFFLFQHPFKRTLSTPLIMQYQSDVRFRSRETHAQGGGTPKREKEKKQPNLVMPIAIGLFIVGRWMGRHCHSYSLNLKF